MELSNITETQIDAALPLVEAGLRKYCWLQGNVKRLNVEKNDEFQRRFNDFYKVRRDENWRAIYYKLMETAKAEGITFPVALRSLTTQTGRIEASFASKLVATLNPDCPVIDKFILGNFDLRLPYHYSSDRENKTISIYNQLCSKITNVMNSNHGEMICSKFQKRYPWADITDTKKIDLVFWKIR